MITVLIESPFQLLQAIELIAIKKKCFLLVRMNDVERNNIQLKKMIELFELKNIFYIRSKYKLMVSAYVLPIIAMSYLAKECYFGDQNSIIFRFVEKFINPKKIWLLDDGVATLNYTGNMQYNRFTIFEDVNGIHNNFKYIHRIIDRRKVSKDVNIIVGGKLVEEKICSREIYDSIIERMIQDFGGDKVETIYVPHRGEQEGNLLHLSNKFKFKTLSNSLPIELIGLEFGYNPLCIASVLSTSLYSMSLLYKNSIFKVYVLQSSDITSRKKEIINLYDKMKTNTSFMFF